MRVKLILASDDSEVLAATQPTERTNAVGSYYVTYTGAVTGHVKAVLTDTSGNLLPDGTFHYRLADTAAIHYPGPADRTATQLKPTKNVAIPAFPFYMVSASDDISPATGLTVTATRSLDGAAFGACANAVSEVANGVYTIDLAAADMNGDTVTLKFTAASANARIVAIVTQSS